MISKAIKVKKNEAEKIRKKLIEKNILQENLKVKRDNKFVYFPVRKKCRYGEFIEEMEFKEKKKSYIEMAKEEGLNIDSISIDFIGNIAIIRLPEHLKKEDKRIAEYIMAANKKIQTVCMDEGVEEEYRIRKLKIIKGNNTHTVHVEYGIKIKLDVTKVYFSPRLATERMRVAKKIDKGSIVIDMFAGVAPFSILIAKYSMPQKVYAIDKNPDAVRYAKENIKLNNVEKIVEVIEGDASNVIKNLPHADHIIMNLPHRSYEFLPYALERGKIIHYYEIMERGMEKERIKRIKEMAEKYGYKIRIDDFRVIGSYSPSKIKAGMEIFVE